MGPRLKFFIRPLGLSWQFLLVTLLVMIAGTIGVSNWVGGQIEAGVIHQNGAMTALSVDGFISPQLQELGKTGILDQAHIQALNTLPGSTPLGKIAVAFTVRDMTGKLLYSSDPTIVGIAPPTAGELATAARGEITSEIDRLEVDTDFPLKKFSDRLVKTYSPVHLSSSGRVFAIIEFYQEADALQAEIAAARRQSWYVVGAFMGGMYLLLAVFFGITGNTIDRQRAELKKQVLRLTDLLGQNRQLHARLRQAAASVATLHERLLRRVGAELHDGPAQDLSLALMQIDTVIGQTENNAQQPLRAQSLGRLKGIENNLKNALTELRAISSGLSLPQLAGLSPEETIAHAASSHERRTGSQVALDLKDLPSQLPLPVKITLYRLVQEALNNSFKHAGGVGQRVCACARDGNLLIQVLDEGPGFIPEQTLGQEGHLGVEGMRERVESLGGTFQIESRSGEGTRVSATWNIQEGGEANERKN